MGRTWISPLPPPVRSFDRETTHVALAKQIYIDGETSLEDFEEAIDVILRGGTIHDTSLGHGLGPPLPPPSVPHVYRGVRIKPSAPSIRSKQP